MREGKRREENGKEKKGATLICGSAGGVADRTEAGGRLQALRLDEEKELEGRLGHRWFVGRNRGGSGWWRFGSREMQGLVRRGIRGSEWRRWDGSLGIRDLV